MRTVFLGFLVLGCGGGDHPPLRQDAGTDASVGDAGNDASDDAGSLEDAGVGPCTSDEECGRNARCDEGACVCAEPFVGDGHLCEALWSDVSTSRDGVCAVRRDRTLWCWGESEAGPGRPVQLGVERTWTDVEVGVSHRCGIAGGRVLCWGDNDYGQLGDGTVARRNEPAEVGGGGEYQALAIGGNHTCALRTDGALDCWGSLVSGLGVESSVPLRVGADTWLDVTAAGEGTCAVRADHALFCWGSNGSGRLGFGDFEVSLEPRQVEDATDWSRVATSPTRTCGVRLDGRLFCWGENWRGRLGTASLDDTVHLPAQVGAASRWTDVVLGEDHRCGLFDDGSASCWGENDRGQLGDGSTVPRAVPLSTADAGPWAALAAGGASACGIRDDGRLWCWGTNALGQLGRGASANAYEPVRVGEADDWAAVAVGAEHVCGLTAGAALFCWGDNAEGAIGSGDTTSTRFPRPSGGATWSIVSTGRARSCGIQGDQSLWCWGDGTPRSWEFRTRPTRVGEDSDWTALAVGASPSCAVRAAGTLHCAPDWVALSAPGPWASAATGEAHQCALARDGSVHCWGSNGDGQLGDGTREAHDEPAPIASSDEWAAVAAGGDFTCALRTDGALFCWGRIGEVDRATEPTRVGDALFRSVAAGTDHVCLIGDDGSLWSFGTATSYGALGTGREPEVYRVPARVGSATDWTFVAAGADTSCGIRGGALYCWGRNDTGQVGDGASWDERPGPVVP